MKAIRISNQFQKGHIYFSETRSGKIKKFEVFKVLVRTSTKERVAVVAKYDGKTEQRYDIKKSPSGVEYVIADDRYCTVIDTTELIEEVKITDDMVSDIHTFNNCGMFTVTISGKQYPVSWNHGKVEADDFIKESARQYIYG